MTLDAVSFEGHAGVRLEDETASLVVTTSAGPRILGLTGRGDNLMAVLPEGGIDLPGGGRFAMIGGHRLWAAPEVPETTYLPDDRPCSAAEIDGGVRVEAPPDDSGLIRALEVRRTGEGWAIDHVLSDTSGTPRTLAPWGISQLRLGGEVIVPGGAPGPGPGADRSIVLWPYSDPEDPRVTFGRDGLRIRAAPGGGRLKLGLAPSDGRILYHLDGEVFEKRIAVEPGLPYADMGAAVQVYLCDDFVELETLGPLTAMVPGQEVRHREVWTLRAEATTGGAGS